jgi:hypothetical protein
MQFLSKPYCVLDRALDEYSDRLDDERALTPAEREIAHVKTWVYFDDAAYTGEQLGKKLQVDTPNQNYYIVPLFMTTTAMKYVQNKAHLLGMETVADDATWTTFKCGPEDNSFLHVYKGQHINDIVDTGKQLGVDHKKLFRSTVSDEPTVYPGLTIFEHKLPDGMSFPAEFSKEFLGLYDTPVYKDPAKFDDANAAPDFLPCAQYEAPPTLTRR